MKVLAFCRILVIFFLLWGCGPGPATEALAELPQGCAASGTIVSADLPGPSRGYPYSYRIYLPPCTSSDGGVANVTSLEDTGYTSLCPASIPVQDERQKSRDLLC
jgi:hypothetical protein